jgi:hypothetical protein
MWAARSTGQDILARSESALRAQLFAQQQQQLQQLQLARSAASRVQGRCSSIQYMTLDGEFQGKP